jgi:hypothetical protein
MPDRPTEAAEGNRGCWPMGERDKMSVPRHAAFRSQIDLTYAIQVWPFAALSCIRGGFRLHPRMAVAKTSSLVDTRVVYCGDNLDQLQKLPAACVDLIYIDPPFNSNRNYEVFWGETKEKRAFEDRHESTRAYIDYMRPRCVELALLARPPASLFPTSFSVLKKTGSLYYHCDWHASHYVKIMHTIQSN